MRFRDLPDALGDVLRLRRFAQPYADATTYAHPDPDATTYGHADTHATTCGHADAHADGDSDTDSKPESAATDPQRGRGIDPDARWSTRRRSAWRDPASGPGLARPVRADIHPDASVDASLVRTARAVSSIARGRAHGWRSRRRPARGRR